MYPIVYTLKFRMHWASILFIAHFCTFTGAITSLAQNLYFAGNGPNNARILGQINIETCEICPEFIIPFGAFPNLQHIVALPNGNIVAFGSTFPNFSGVIGVFDPPSSVPLSTFTLPGYSIPYGAVLAPNGNVYFLVLDDPVNVFFSFYEFNPVTNTPTLIGAFPAGNYGLRELFYWNGALYSFYSSPIPPVDRQLVTIQIGNPMNFTIIQSVPSLCGGPTTSITSGPYAGIYGSTLDPNCNGGIVYEYDIPSGSITPGCELNPYGFPSGLSAVPPGFPSSPCLCVKSAGNVNTASTVLCGNESLTFNVTGTLLETNDLLRYVLFTNPGDTAGSIVAISDTPQFALQAPLQANVTYYFAAMVGDELNGNIDLDDPCLDFSNANTVIWRPLPSVTLTASIDNLCPGDCTTLNFNLSGSPPFSLTIEGPWGTQIQNFNDNTGVGTFCIPPGVSPQQATVSVIALSDQWCTCAAP